MLQGHVFDSFTAKELRESGPHVLSQFLGGMPPAIFLFLTGITLAFLMDSRERAGEAPWQRVGSSLRRAGYLFSLAFLFRLQLWAFAWPKSPWTDLFNVDILNSMGLAIGFLSLMAVFQTVERVRLCAVLCVAIAVASPIISALDWSGIHPFVRSYIAPDYNAFSFFPWAAYVAFGISAGSILRLTNMEKTQRLMQWGSLLGFGLIFGGQYFSNIPYSIYANSQFWLNSPALVFMKLGIMLLLLSFAYLWTQYGAAGRWSWVRQLGTTSLLVYWVHTELVYGRWLWTWKENLSIAQTTVAAAVVILLMLGLSTLRTRLKGWRLAELWSGLRLPAASSAPAE